MALRLLPDRLDLLLEALRLASGHRLAGLPRALGLQELALAGPEPLGELQGTGQQQRRERLQHREQRIQGLGGRVSPDAQRLIVHGRREAALALDFSAH